MKGLFIQGSFLVLLSLQQISAQCTDYAYRLYVGKHVSGGSRTPAGDGSAVNCAAQCSAQSATCVGYDLTVNTNQCYLINNFRTDITDDLGANHYRLQAGCVSTARNEHCFFGYAGGVSFNNAVTTAAADLKACGQACVDNAACTAYTWQANINECKILTQSAATSPVTVNTAVQAYERRLCASCPRYEQFIGQSVTSGLPQVNLATLDACRDGCTAQADCLGFNFLAAGATKCFFITDANAENTRSIVAGTDNYWRVCRNAATPPTTGCVATWTYNNNTAANGGDFKAQYTTLADCQKACAEDNTCAAIDVDFNPSAPFCWFHNSPIGTLRTQNAVFHLVLVDRCPTVCTPTFTRKNDTSSSGGQPEASANTEALCKAACIANTACVAIDVDFNGGTLCWLHLNPANILSTRTQTNVYQYIISRECTTTVSTTVATTTVSTASTTGSGCRADWELKNNTSSAGGSARSDLTTPTQCQDACVADTTCKGIDVDYRPGNNLCWFHTTDATLAATRATPNVFQYVLRDRCVTTPTCEAIWTTINSRSSGGGQRKSEFTSVETCQKACQDDNTCIAIDVVGGSECWFHLDANNLNDQRNSQGIVQYVLQDRCVTASTTAPGCVASWTPKNNTNSQGGTAESAYTTFEACAEACIKDTTCVAIDVNFNGGNLCWFHRDANNIAATGQAAGVFQYVLNSRCATTATTPACIARWTIKNNTNSQGGVVQTYTTAEECQQKCIEDTSCVGIDVNFGPGQLCWFHLNANNLDTTGVANGVFQYKLEDRCVSATGTTSGTGCAPPVWKITNNTHAFGGSDRTDLTTAQACLTACLGDLNCLGVDLDFNTNAQSLCWFHTSASNFANTGPLTNAYLYELVDRCPTSTVTPSSSPCDPLWEITNNTHAFNGIANNAATAAACLDACAKDPSCKGVDLDFNPNAASLCWFHTNEADFADTGPLNNVYLYVLRDRCPGVCEPQWVMTNNTHAFNGIARTEFTTAATCLKACIDDTTCVGVDLDFGGVTFCWFHTNRADFGDTETLTDAYLYELIDRCPQPGTSTTPATTTRTTQRTSPTTRRPTCVPRWSIQNDTHAFNGVAREDLLTPDACLNECVADSRCVGVDLDFRQGETLCWFHTNQNDISDTGPQLNTYFYILVDRCPVGCVPLWQPNPNRNAFGGTEFQTVTTQEECFQTCVDTPTCVAVDIDSNAQSTLCWLHLNSNNLNDLGDYVGNTLWILEDRCPGSGTSPAPGPLVCGMHRYLSTNVNGGQNMGQFPSPEACMSQCFFTQACVASDFDRNTGECYFHTVLNTRQTNNCCIRFERVCQLGGCFDKFESYPNRIGVGGTLRSGITTTEACGTLCLSEPQCEGYDVRIPRLGGQCLTHVRSYGDSLREDPNYIANARVRCIIPQEITSTQITPVDCFGDLLFIIDESSSVTLPNFLAAKQYIKDIISQLPISPNRVQVSVITYSDTARAHFDLNDRVTLDSVLLAIDSIPYMGGSSNTPSALAVARSIVFQRIYGDRDNVPNTVVLITDGETSSNVGSELLGAVNELKRIPQIQIYVIGVTNQVNVNELRIIATSNDKVTLVSSYTDLVSRGLQASDLGLCEQVTQPPPVTSPTPPTTTTTVPDLVRCELDLILVIDSSGSINDENPGNFAIVRQSLNNLIGTLDNNGHLANNVRIALLSFGSQSFLRLNLDNGFTSAFQYQFHVDRLPYDGGDTNTTGALKTVREDVLRNSGNRQTVPDVILLLTDGQPTVDVDRLDEEVQLLRNARVRTVGVGVTNRVNETIMNDIVSPPLNQNYFRVQDFGGLVGRVDQILQGTCQEITTTQAPVRRCNLDLAFVVDSSGSIRDKGEGNWKLILDFVSDIVDFVDLNEVQVAALSYSNKAIPEFNFNEGIALGNKQNVTTAIRALTYDGGTTNTTGGLRYARDFFFQTQYGDRPDVANLIILLTDGATNTEKDALLSTAANIRNVQNTRIMAVGVTNEVDINELNSIASDRGDGEKEVFTVERFQDLAQELQTILGGTCRLQPVG